MSCHGNESLVMASSWHPGFCHERRGAFSPEARLDVVGKWAGSFQQNG